MVLLLFSTPCRTSVVVRIVSVLASRYDVVLRSLELKVEPSGPAVGRPVSLRPPLFIKKAAVDTAATQTSNALELLRDSAGDAFLLQRGYEFFVVEIPGHIKGLGSFDGVMLLDPWNSFDGAVHRFDTFAAAEVCSLNLQSLHLLTAGSGLRIQRRYPVRFSEITCFDQGIRCLLHGGFVRAGQ